jgi:hypothetical protein
MQSDYKVIYKLTAKRTGKNEVLYKDLGNFVFAEFYSMLRRPKSLITKLQGVGSWFLRKKRIVAIVDAYPADYTKKQEEFSSEFGFLKNENKKEIHALFHERIKEYEEYTKEKQEIRKQRNKTQMLLKPKSEDES